MTILDQLHGALVTYPCRCEYERNAAGVPLWTTENGELKRKLIRQCARCAAIEQYDIENHVEKQNE